MYANAVATHTKLKAKLPLQNQTRRVSLADELMPALVDMMQYHYLQHSKAEQLLLPLSINDNPTPLSFYQRLAAELYSPGASLIPNPNHVFAIKADTLPLLSIVLTLHTELENNDLFDVLGFLAKQFKLHVYLSAATPELVLENTYCMSLLKSGLVERLQITDQAYFFAHDTVEFIKKLNTKEVFVCNAEQLIRHSFALLKFYYVSNRGLLDQYEIAIAIEPLQAAKLLAEDVLPVHVLQNVFGKKDYAKKTNCFTTTSAVSRIGSLATFRQLALNIGACAVGQIDQWWQLGVLNSSAKGLKVIPLELALPENQFLLFDLQPAAVFDDPLYRYIPPSRQVLRRWLICARIMPQVKPAANVKPARFIMTNFNKAQFLADAIYSVLLQSHPDCKVLLLDDNSTDDSLAKLDALQRFLPKGFLNIEKGAGKEGTYRLRNRAIANCEHTNTVYLVNDADDLSCARRAELQMAQLSVENRLYTFADIVRVTSQGEVLALDGATERYGTASFCAPAAIHQTYGYYENLRKGADTEFIERLAYFAPKNVGYWWRYPVLFQSFDGNNLTQDIYTVTAQGALAQDISARTPYMQLFRERHKRLITAWLPLCFTADNLVFPADYLATLPDFMLPGSVAKNNADTHHLTTLNASKLFSLTFEAEPPLLKTSLQTSVLHIDSHLAAKQHAYLLFASKMSPDTWQGQQAQQTAIYFDVENTVGISFCLIYQDSQGNQISHQFFWANQLMPVKIPNGCKQVQLGFRLQGPGTADIKQIELKAWQA
ncbi:glycosyltransferase family 2 protein [Rheinheimera sp. UJ51]|uniref:glycosyltransferase family A protein n=1 Tax=Rheinheimera sp. UJ51 TaxID=2892446 RepID=UPI001E3C3F93|nr:glycosyltransferase family A protein [Rheinheimera sp. UJ51]MCC5450277.1 glycosyltransferase family 2 protein [Rheinheimera sp. UJ51]